MQRQALAGKSFLYSTLPLPEYIFVLREQEKVVYIAQVGWTAELTLHEMVEAVEINIAPELAGEVSDRQPARTRNRKKVILSKIHHLIFFREHAHAAGKDAVT